MNTRLAVTAAARDGIASIREEYESARCTFIDGETMRHLILGLGASPRHLEELQYVSEALTTDPTLPFRKSANARFRFKGDTVTRLVTQPFVLTAAEDFIRRDSGELRQFDEISVDLQANSAFWALLAFKMICVRGIDVRPRRHLDYDVEASVCTLFHLRTVTEGELLGEPALEGVHSDGADHTMTTYLGSRNMTTGSAVTLVHDPQEVSGTPWAAVDPALVRGRYQHRRFLDTLLIADHELKHSVSSVLAEDPSRPAMRDMLVFFTRRFASTHHASYGYDSDATYGGGGLELHVESEQESPVGRRNCR